MQECVDVLPNLLGVRTVSEKMINSLRFLIARRVRVRVWVFTFDALGLGY